MYDSGHPSSCTKEAMKSEQVKLELINGNRVHLESISFVPCYAYEYCLANSFMIGMQCSSYDVSR